MSAPTATTPTAAAATTTATNVHIEIPGFAAVSERGHWDACGPIAELDALHVCPWTRQGVVLNETAIASTRWQYVEANHWRGHGCYLSDIHWHLQHIGAHIAGYVPFSDTPDLATLHTFVKQQLVAQNPVIIEVSRAYNLPKNEAGVDYHFVALGGIDSTQGYLVANGDTVDAFSHPAGATLPLNWATWQQLVNAGICGAIALQRILPTPPTPTPVPTVPPVPPIGLADAIAQAEALVAALKAMQQA